MLPRQERRFARRTLLKSAISLGLALLTGQVSCLRNLPFVEQSQPGQEAEPAQSSGPPSDLPIETQSVVAIVRGENPKTMVRQAVGLAGGLSTIVRPGTTVFLKPNLTIPSQSGRGNVTDSRVLQAVIELCQEAGAARVLVGDGSGGGDSREIMRQAGYEPALATTGAEFVDLNSDAVATAKVSAPDGLSEYSIAKTVLTAPVFISLPVLKVHQEAIVSLSCKNLMGITSRQAYGASGPAPRQRLHDIGVPKVISDIVRIKTPDFAIIDGTVGLEGNSPMNGTPVPMNLIIAGRSPVSVDAVGAAVMGFSPLELEQLILLAHHKVGEIDLSNITVKGSSIAEVLRRFGRW